MQGSLPCTVSLQGSALWQGHSLVAGLIQIPAGHTPSCCPPALLGHPPHQVAEASCESRLKREDEDEAEEDKTIERWGKRIQEGTMLKKRQRKRWNYYQNPLDPPHHKYWSQRMTFCKTKTFLSVCDSLGSWRYRRCWSRLHGLTGQVSGGWSVQGLGSHGGARHLDNNNLTLLHITDNLCAFSLHATVFPSAVVTFIINLIIWICCDFDEYIWRHFCILFLPHVDLAIDETMK